MKVAVIIPAAGMGKRFSGEEAGSSLGLGTIPASKIEHNLAGRAVFLRAVELFVGRPEVDQIILAVHPQRVDDFNLRWGDKLSFHGVEVVAGGTVERWQTVAKAIAAVGPSCTHIAVHDAARPLTSSPLIDRVFEAGQHHDAVIPGLSVRSTLKRVVEEQARNPDNEDPINAILGSSPQAAAATKRVAETLDRRQLVEAQTPQLFERKLLEQAYASIDPGPRQDDPSLATITDDASLVERLGQAVYVVAGEPGNWKITDPQDMELAQVVLTASLQAQGKDLARKRLFADDED